MANIQSAAGLFVIKLLEGDPFLTEQVGQKVSGIQEDVQKQFDLLGPSILTTGCLAGGF